MGDIYAIVNTTTDAVYVGSSARGAQYRWSQHRKALRAGTHHSRHLQRAWAKYGPTAFRLAVIEQGVPDVELLAREQHHIDVRLTQYPRQLTYNACPTAGNCRGRKFSPETLAKLSASHRGIRRSKTQRAKQVRTWQAKYGRQHVLVSPEGQVCRFRNIRAFVRRHGLDSSGVGLLLRGRLRRYKGWVRPDSPLDVLVDPAGVRHARIANLKQFCAENGLGYKGVFKVVRGENRSYRGWTCPTPRPAFRRKKGAA